MNKQIPIGSSLVENQTTCEGFGVFGLARRMDRIALSPWVRGCAAPNTFKPSCLDDLKLGAPCTLRSRSSARPGVIVA